MSISNLSELQSRLNDFTLEKRAFPTSSVLALVKSLENQGIPSDTSLAGTNIDLSSRRVTYKQRIEQLSNMLDLIGMDGVWLDSRRAFSILDYGPLGYAMLTSETLEESIQVAVKYCKTVGAMFDLTFEVEGDEALIKVENLLPVGRVGRYTIESLFARMNSLFEFLVGKEHNPSRVILNYRAPRYASKYLQRFRCPVIFDRATCEYRFSRSSLSVILPNANKNANRLAEESCRKLLKEISLGDDIVLRICNLLVSTPGEFPKLDAVANKLSLGARTLRRRLNDLGTSYQRILDDVRQELAVEYLGTTNLTVQEIAELLGYSEVTNFRRAFMRWFELSPHQYRQRMSALA